jgi:hypothetical protein
MVELYMWQQVDSSRTLKYTGNEAGNFPKTLPKENVTNYFNL